MNTARHAQAAKQKDVVKQEQKCVFTTQPHPSQKQYVLGGRADIKANIDIAKFVDLDKINKYNIGIDASYQVITDHSYCLQHGNLEHDQFSIKTAVFGSDACHTFDQNEKAATAKCPHDSSNGESGTDDSFPSAKCQLKFNNSHTADDFVLEQGESL